MISPQRGRFRVRAQERLWSASSHQAMWIPPGVVHCVEALDDLSIHNVYVCTREVPGLPQTCKVLSVTPLLRELLAFGMTEPTGDGEEQKRLLLTITDQIRRAPDLGTIHVPMAEDRRLLPILEHLCQHPDDNRPLEAWAAFTHSSTRTLARLFVQETGLTFREWRQRLRLMEAVARLGSGQSVLEVALDLGYASQSAFTAMFRKTLGCTPSDYPGRERGEGG
nr:AraC family transcriptional regulator [Pararhodospirillum oryzae]